MTKEPVYFLSQNEEVSGPYDLEAIQALIQSGSISLDARVQIEGGSEWVEVRQLLEPSRDPSRQRTRPWLWLGGGLALFALVLCGAITLMSPGDLPVFLNPAPALPPSRASADPATVAKWPKVGEKWTNSLGLEFVPAGTNGVLFCIYDVRVQDFEKFISETHYVMTGNVYCTKFQPIGNGFYQTTWGGDANATWQNPGYPQAPNHPVVGISWYDTQAFCQWLTNKERAAGLLGPDQGYRLPKDVEWSAAVGDSTYPWGGAWPPPDKAGNYCDLAWAETAPGKGWKTLASFDGYPWTSPVGSFPPNAFGLYDMGGNVWQWCDDWYVASMNYEEVRKAHPELENDGGGHVHKVERGGSWDDFEDWCLRSDCREDSGPSFKNQLLGFRLVLSLSD